jgi:teichuronic acid biosynthesis glycosyltransferase TuaG
MDHGPLVSVIVPTCNRATRIGPTLESVLAQSHNNLELIVVDDGSTDATAEVLAEIKDSRLHYSVIPHAGRPAVPRNYGMRMAKGDYIAFCDDDDLWAPNKLEKQVAVMESRSDLLMTCTNVTFLPDRAIMKKTGKNETRSFENLLFNSDIVNSSVVMRRSVIDDLGYLDEDIRLKASEDYDYWCRLLAFRDQSVLFMAEPLTYYNRNIAGSISSFTVNNIDDLYARMAIIQGKFATKYPGLIKRASAYYEHRREIDKDRFRLLAREIFLRDIWKNTMVSTSEKCRTTIIWALFMCCKISRGIAGSHWRTVEKHLARIFCLAGLNIQPYLSHFSKFY